jgi:hypothetical protein
MQRLYTFALIVLLLIATSLVYAFTAETGQSALPACTSGCERPQAISCSKPEVSEPAIEIDMGAGQNIIARMIEIY